MRNNESISYTNISKTVKHSVNNMILKKKTFQKN